MVRLIFVFALAVISWVSTAEAGQWTARCTLTGPPTFTRPGDNSANGIAAALDAYHCLNAGARPPTCAFTSDDTVWCRSHGNNFNCNGSSSLANALCYSLSTLNCASGETLIGGKCVATVPCRGNCAKTTANPIEIVTGRKVGAYTDWTTGGAQALSFVRHYSSESTFFGAPAISILGSAWRSNFDARARYVLSVVGSTPYTAATDDRVHIAMPDGVEQSFVKASSGAWNLVVPRITSTGNVLWDTAQTDVDITLSVSATEVTLQTPAGIKYVFDLKGLLARIEQLDGYAQFLEYSTNDDLPVQVTDSKGRTLQFAYFTDMTNGGLLRSVFTSDGKEIKFTYESRFVPPADASLPPSWHVNGFQALSSVIYPDSTPATDTDNPRKTFEYMSDTARSFALTGITDERGIKNLTVTYDSLGRALTSELADGADKVTMTYDDINSDVTVTNALGRSTIYSYGTLFGSVRRITAVDGIATANCLASNTAYGYDSNGFRNQATDAEGRITQWTNNARGLPLSETRGVGTPQAVTVTRTWDASRPLPASIAEPGRTTSFAYNSNGLIQSITEQDTTTTTVPYSTNGTTRTTAFGYQTLTLPAPPALTPPGSTFADVPLTIANADAAALTGWTTITGTVTIRTTGSCSVADPCFYSSTSSRSVLQQDVAIPSGNIADVDAGRMAATINWKQYASSTGIAGTKLAFLDASGVIIGTFPNALTAETAEGTRERTTPIPPLARTIRILLQWSGGAVALDNIALTLTASGTATATPYIPLTNPDAASMTGWTLSAGTVVAATSSPCHSALFSCFRDSTAAITESAYQDITIPSDRLTEVDNNARRVRIEWIGKSNNLTSGYGISIAFLDASDAEIAGKGKEMPAISGTEVWNTHILEADVPTLARKIKLTQIFSHRDTSTRNSAMTGFTVKLTGRNAPPPPHQVLASVDGPLAGTGDTTSYTYDANGILAQVTDEVGHITEIVSVNGQSQPTLIRDPNGIDTALAYNDRGWLTTITVNPGASQAVTTIAYDAAGNVTRITEADGSYLQYDRDNAGRVSLVSNNSGETIAYGYDLQSNMTSTTVKTSAGAIVRQMTMVYDEIGRLMKSIGAATQETVYSYDRTDLTTQVKDPRNNLYSYAYDSLARLIQETDQESAQVNLTRDGQDDVVAYQDPRTITTSYVRNGFGEVIQETSPDAGTTIFVRDLRGLVTQETDGRGVVTNRTYDNAGRLLTETYPAATAENVTYAYDDVTGGNKGVGRLTSVADQSGSTSWVYDALGRVTSETRVIGGQTYATAYQYDLAGRVSEITYPSGRIVMVARDATGRVTGVTTKQNAAAATANVATGILFKPMSNLLSSLNHGNGLTTTAGYDQDYRLTSLALMDGAVAVLSRSYSYGDGLNLTGVTDNVTPANSNTLAYSAANRLASASGAWGANSFSYDSVGNRLTDVTSARNRQATYGASDNRLSSITENAAAFRSYTYDGAGNTITETRPGESFAYAYNNRNRLVSVTRNSVSWASYGYNALEQLVTRNSSSPAAPSGTIHYLYDLDGHLMAEADGSTGAILRDYIWLLANDNGNDAPGGAFSDDLAVAGAANDNTPPDLPLAVIDGVNTASPQTYQVHTDHLGRPVAMTDASKATVWSATWTPWGEAHSLTGSAVNNLRFPGQYFLIETGHAYNWHRSYDPVSGRYTQPDPLRFVNGPSVYAYAGNSPFMNTDREGLDDRYFAGNLHEQLVMQDAWAQGQDGPCIISPTNFPAGGKKFQVKQNGIVVHYMCNCNGILGDFKFKN